jgi:hypothetical protein
MQTFFVVIKEPTRRLSTVRVQLDAVHMPQVMPLEDIYLNLISNLTIPPFQTLCHGVHFAVFEWDYILTNALHFSKMSQFLLLVYPPFMLFEELNLPINLSSPKRISTYIHFVPDRNAYEWCLVLVVSKTSSLPTDPSQPNTWHSPSTLEAPSHSIRNQVS